MFTGIIQGMGTVRTIADKKGLRSFVVAAPSGFTRGLKLGASVSVSGACLTVTRVRGNAVSFDAMQETLQKTTLGTLTVGDRVNLERSATLGDEIGGHLVSGHVSGTGKIVSIKRPPNNCIVRVRVDRALMPYIFSKGFIAIDGASLTIVDVFADGFTVHLIPETLARTTFAARTVGDRVNIEIDARTQAIVETMRRLKKRQ